MAQDIYAAARAHTRSIPADQTPEAVLARYRAANPEDTGATVAVPGDENYAGPATLDPNAQVYVKDRPLTDSRLQAQVQAERMIPATDAAGREQSLMQGVLLNGADELGGRLAQGGQMVRNLADRLQGRPVQVNSSDLNDAYVETYRSRQADFARQNPIQAGGLQLAGGLLTGGASFGTGLAGAAATGAAYGAGAGGLGATGSFAQRLPSAAIGGAAGGALGAGAAAAAPYASRLAGITGAGMRRIIPARQSVAERFAPLVDDAAVAERQRLQGLGLNPSVMDVLPQRAERLVRTAAGPAGPGAEMAVTRSRDLTQNLKPDIMSDTRALNGDPRTATQVREGLLDTRSTLAEQQYAPAYEAQVPVTEEIISAISDAPGRAALNRARQAAVARRNVDQVTEIDRLLNGDTSQPVSAGTLDRVRIAMGNRAEALSRNATGARDIAGGLNSRAGDINAALDNVPALAPARETYANLSGAVDALDNAGQVFSLPPEDFAQVVQNLTPEQRQASIIGVRQEIMETLGGQKAAGTGTLDRIAQAPYARQNLAMLLGEDEAARYLAQIDARVQQTQRAARVSPNTNSQTFGRGLDEETFNAANMVGAAVDGARAARGDPLAFGRTLDRLRARATMSPADREAIVAMGFSDANELENIVRLAQEAQDAGRPVPRAVRAFIVDSRNVLGSQSPVPQQLERLLLPTQVSAEEENQ